MDSDEKAGDNIDMKAAAKAFSQLGASKGGKARAEKLSPEQRREIALRASESRWAKIPHRSTRPTRNYSARDLFRRPHNRWNRPAMRGGGKRV